MDHRRRWRGWIFDRKYRAKWIAEIALKVFTDRGKVSDYWREVRERAKGRVKKVPTRALKEMEGSLEAILDLNPTCDEIEEFAKGEGYGVVTITDDNEYFPPHLHNAWGKKWGGRVHVDIGCRGYHLMLDKGKALQFIAFVKSKRKIEDS
jgi:TusA-related sulfurtransferase